jgi:hypothetical protein
MYIFDNIAQILLKMKNGSDKYCRENQNTHFMFSIFLFRKSCAIYEIMWKKYGTAGQATDDSIIRRMCFACWVTKGTNTHSEYVILITFPWQQRFRDRDSVSRYTYISFCLVYFHAKQILSIDSESKT